MFSCKLPDNYITFSMFLQYFFIILGKSLFHLQGKQSSRFFSHEQKMVRHTEKLRLFTNIEMVSEIYEPKFSDGSYGYRPHRSAKDAILKVKEYADEGYKYAVCLDLSKYFDTLNHELLMNMLRKDIKDKRLIDLIKKYLKSGVMENGIVMKTEEGSPQGGNLSPLLANIYLDKFDKEFEGRGVKVIRYADDIIFLAKSIRVAERLLGTSTAYLEKKLKLKVNTEKSRAESVYSIRNFGFSALRWEGTERVHISEFTQSRRRKPRTNCGN